MSSFLLWVGLAFFAQDTTAQSNLDEVKMELDKLRNRVELLDQENRKLRSEVSFSRQEETPEKQETPAKEETPEEQETPAKEETPEEQETPAKEEAPAEEESPAEIEGQDLSSKSQDKRSNPIYSRMDRFGSGLNIGGYIDSEFWNTEGSTVSTFDQHRFVPFFYADISDNLKMAVELEFDHGHEVGIEFATLDYWFSDAINFRTGIILAPLGQFNLVHDAPYQDLTQRPLVDSTVIPAVLRDVGMGFFGSFDADPWLFSYEIYVMNGFEAGADGDSDAVSTSNGLKKARVSEGNYKDSNDNKSVVARVTASPFLGMEFGLSYWTGAYDKAGDLNLDIMAFDFTISGGGLYNAFFGGDEGMLRDILYSIEIVGEYASADLDTDATHSIDGLSGYYVELRYHFMFDAVKSVIPGSTDESTFTAILRWDDVDLDGAKREALTFGLNYRPREDTVFKFEYSLKGESGDLSDSDNDVFAFSVSSYF